MKLKPLPQNPTTEIDVLIEQQNKDHFVSERSTSNTARTVWRCAEFNPCRRTDCSGCMERRRSYFVYMGTRHARHLGLNMHITLSWPLGPGEMAGERLLSLSTMITKRLTGRIGAFIRVLAIGDQGVPHVHYLICSDFEVRFRSLAKDNSPNGSATRISSKSIYDLEGIIDYLFVMNFAPTASDPRKPRGMRLASGTRGDLTYSYPRTIHWDRYIGLLTGEIVDEQD